MYTLVESNSCDEKEQQSTPSTHLTEKEKENKKGKIPVNFPIFNTHFLGFANG